jgi:hypothetical protein
MQLFRVSPGLIVTSLYAEVQGVINVLKLKETSHASFVSHQATVMLQKAKFLNTDTAIAMPSLQ